MIHPGNGVRIYVAVKPVDFRKGHDGLAALVQSHLKKDPFGGAVYVFRAKRADRLKMIYWDGMGLVMAYMDLSRFSSGSLMSNVHQGDNIWHTNIRKNSELKLFA